MEGQGDYVCSYQTSFSEYQNVCKMMLLVQKKLSLRVPGKLIYKYFYEPLLFFFICCPLFGITIAEFLLVLCWFW